MKKRGDGMDNSWCGVRVNKSLSLELSLKSSTTGCEIDEGVEPPRLRLTSLSIRILTWADAHLRRVRRGADKSAGAVTQPVCTPGVGGGGSAVATDAATSLTSPVVGRVRHATRSGLGEVRRQAVCALCGADRYLTPREPNQGRSEGGGWGGGGGEGGS